MIKSKTILFCILGVIIAILVIAAGWYLIRFTATSQYQDQAWQTNSDGHVPIRFKAVDEKTSSELRPVVDRAISQITSFFDKPFPGELTFYLLPDRAALDHYWRTAFNSPWFVSTCWMVGTGSAAQLSILSPREWRSENCGHDPDDADEIYRLIVHELTHSFHDQINPSEDIGIYEDIGWFIEGVAVHVSGQLDDGRLASPAEAIKLGEAPDQLEDAWSGKYRYGVSGSMVEYIESMKGRQALLELMRLTTEDEILSRLGMTEAEFLNGWQHYVLTNRGQTTSSSFQK